jgi:hypothetical protein
VLLRIVLWTLVGIIALDALLASAIVAYAAMQRRRSSERVGDRRWTSWGPAALRSRRAQDGSVSRRFAATAIVVAFVGVGTAMASPGARQVVATMFGNVARQFGFAEDERGVERAAEDVALPGTRVVPPVLTGRVPRTGHLPPAVDAARPRSSAGSSAAPGSSGEHASAAWPESPAMLTAVASSSSAVDVRWADVSTETAFRLERSIYGTTGWDAVATTGRDENGYHDAGLEPGTTYYYRVFATNAVGSSEASGTASATTGVDPASPTSVVASAGSPTQVDLVWVDVAYETGYRVERSLDPASGWTTIATTGQDVTGYHDAGLQAGTTYYYRVFATNAAGDSPSSDVAQASTPAPKDLSGPTGPTGATDE